MMPYRKVPLGRKLGRRGSILALFGSGFVVYGVNLIITGRESVPGISDLLHVAPFGVQIPFEFWGGLWVFNGLLALLHTYRRAPGADSHGYHALIVMPCMWMLFYLACALGALLGEPWGDPIGVLRAVVWLMLLGVILIEAGSPEPRPTSPESPPDAQGG